MLRLLWRVLRARLVQQAQREIPATPELPVPPGLRAKSAPPGLRARREKPVPWALLVLQEQMEPREIQEPPAPRDQQAQMVKQAQLDPPASKEFKAPQVQPERKAKPVMLARQVRLG